MLMINFSQISHPWGPCGPWPSEHRCIDDLTRAFISRNFIKIVCLPTTERYKLTIISGFSALTRIVSAINMGELVMIRSFTSQYHVFDYFFK